MDHADAPADPPFDITQATADDLLTPGDMDPLDTGYSPPDREPWAARRLYREGRHEPLEERLDDELPEVWQSDAEAVDYLRTGRLESVDEDGIEDVFAQDEGLDGLADSAEEAAMHYDA